MANKTVNNQALANLIKEKERISGVKAEISRRIEELQEELHAQNKGFEKVGFNIDSIESQAVAGNTQAILSKIRVLEASLKQSSYTDQGFRNAAKQYVESVEEAVKNYDKMISDNNERLAEYKRQVKELTEKNEIENRELKNEIDILLDPLEWSTEGIYADHTGEHQVNKIKNVLKKYIK